jgi:hypothetical protein
LREFATLETLYFFGDFPVDQVETVRSLKLKRINDKPAGEFLRQFPRPP